MMTVSVHWTFGVYGSVQRIHSAVTRAGNAGAEREEEDLLVEAKASPHRGSRSWA